MKKIILTAAAVLALSGSAFAVGSDHFNPTGTPAVTAVDSTYTASIKTSEPAAQTPAVPGSDRSLFGNN